MPSTKTAPLLLSSSACRSGRQLGAYGFPLKAASAIAPSSGREVPVAISREEIYKLIECYGDAAARAQRAGIDMVEVHCAHGYLVSTFISSRTNNRLDEFGGCFENRMRLPRLIIENHS